MEDMRTPLKVYTIPRKSGIIAIDGVVRNVAFTNTDTGIITNTICYPEENVPEESKPEESENDPEESMPEESDNDPEESMPEELENNTEESNPEEINLDGSCGSYAENEEIKIENNKCVLDLGSSQDLRGDWKFTFEFKLNSMPETDDLWWKDILSGIDSF